MKKGNVAIITGASSGMGREFAVQISKKYRTINEIWVIARRKERLEELAGELDVERVKILALDVTDQDDMQIFEQELEREKPNVRILVNAAGYGMIGKVQEMNSTDNTGMVDINCKALTQITHMVLPYIGRMGQIIQLASSAAFMPQPEFAVYAASKAYVLSFSRALGREVKDQEITVTSVCPGPVKTEFFDIAETYNQVKLYKRLAMARADRVVAKALADARKGKTVSVYGLTMNAFRVLCKVFPIEFLLQFF